MEEIVVKEELVDDYEGDILINYSKPSTFAEQEMPSTFGIAIKQEIKEELDDNDNFIVYDETEVKEESEMYTNEVDDFDGVEEVEMKFEAEDEIFLDKGYEVWLNGEDIGPHPEDPDRKVAAPLPPMQDILCNKNNTSLPQCFLEASKKGHGPMNYSHRFPEFPAELHLELVEEDNMNYSDDIAPDKQQLEVLEDTWLKTGEIEAEDATICSAGYNLRKRPVPKDAAVATSSSGGGKGRPKKAAKKFEADELIGIYAPCDGKSKKVCGPIVAPLSILEDAKNELVKSLVAQETKHVMAKKQNKHKDRDSEKKQKKRKHHHDTTILPKHVETINTVSKPKPVCTSVSSSASTSSSTSSGTVIKYENAFLNLLSQKEARKKDKQKAKQRIVKKDDANSVIAMPELSFPLKEKCYVNRNEMPELAAMSLQQNDV
ncbi:unnamed protein product [Brassicogethes aeneus]|uniref:Uncharacterized protein n=1 Tax=Brassicogethes aeneus TaxID=1431903 RepID=A0A9P0AVV7_BRAAE|nr:unnamed protein product [Brassicogethes aeneus]